MTTMNGATPGAVDGRPSLDSIEYDPIGQIDAIFAHPISLESIDEVCESLRDYQDELDEEVASLVATQAGAEYHSQRRMQAAKQELSALFMKIETLRERALETEKSITDMTAEIKRLDGTKRNLTLSMTALKRLQMLTTAYEQLHELGQTKQYRECAQLLQAVIQLMTFFKSYRSIEQIATLSRNISDIQRELLEQICEDFETAFTRHEVQQDRTMLAEGCLVMDAMSDTARARLTTWYCNVQLREYRQIFNGSDEASSLDNIARRYSWLKRVLKTYDSEHVQLFPAHWRVSEALCRSYCEETKGSFRTQLAGAMRTTGERAPDVDLLVSCLQETLEFEQALDKRISNEPRMSVDTTSSIDEQLMPFAGAISEAFEPYLGLWVQSQDQKLAGLIPRYRQQFPGLLHEAEEFSSQTVMPSSTDLFQFYRNSLAQCARVSQGQRLVELSETFAKYLNIYAEQVLSWFLTSEPATTKASLQNIVILMNTADYCQKTAAQLEEKLQSRLEDSRRSQVDFKAQQDTFLGVVSSGIKMLVQYVRIDCEPIWREMRNMPWHRMDAANDQSNYVGELARSIRLRTGEVLAVLGRPQYARAVGDNVIEMTANAWASNLALCKPISEVGAEQMLLDTYTLRKALESLLDMTLDSTSIARTGFIRRTQTALARYDPILKTLQVPSAPPEAFIQAYLIHIHDGSLVNFVKMLALKGITKRSEISRLSEIFEAHRISQDSLLEANGILTQLPIGEVKSNSTKSSGNQANAPANGANNQFGGLPQNLPSLPTLSEVQERLSPQNINFAQLMSAAKDGVERLGSASPGMPAMPNLGAIAERALSPPAVEEGEHIKGLGIDHGEGDRAAPGQGGRESLRGFGKFFRRGGGAADRPRPSIDGRG